MNNVCDVYIRTTKATLRDSILPWQLPDTILNVIPSNLSKFTSKLRQFMECVYVKLTIINTGLLGSIHHSHNAFSFTEIKNFADFWFLIFKWIFSFSFFTDFYFVFAGFYLNLLLLVGPVLYSTVLFPN